MQNFGYIKTVFNDLIVEGIVKKDISKKNIFKKYLKAIKESEILKTQFLVYNNIENIVESDILTANIFINENLKLLEKFDKADILKENEKLIKLLGGTIKIDKTHELSNLHESLTKLIFSKRTPDNILSVTNDIKNVTNYIISNKPKEINEHFDLPTSILTNLMVKKYNEKYDTLEESDKKIIKVLLSTNFNDKKRLYNDIVNECTLMVDRLLIESDGEQKEKLSKVKEKLSNGELSLTEENFIANFSKLVQLKNNLHNN